jgi:uncharacterized protein (DUF3820 family)
VDGTGAAERKDYEGGGGEVTISDKTTFPFGKHKGQLLGDVPASYLLWFYDQEWAPKFMDIMEYVAKNRLALEKEAREDSTVSQLIHSATQREN